MKKKETCHWIYSNGSRCRQPATNIKAVGVENWHCWVLAPLCKEHGEEMPNVPKLKKFDFEIVHSKKKSKG